MTIPDDLIEQAKAHSIKERGRVDKNFMLLWLADFALTQMAHQSAAYLRRPLIEKEK